MPKTKTEELGFLSKFEKASLNKFIQEAEQLMVLLKTYLKKKVKLVLQIMCIFYSKSNTSYTNFGPTSKLFRIIQVFQNKLMKIVVWTELLYTCWLVRKMESTI